MIRVVAGTVILLSLVLAYTVSPYWYLMTAFVGVNLLHLVHRILPPGSHPEADRYATIRRLSGTGRYV